MFIIPYILEEDDLVNLTDEQLSDLAKCSTVMIQDEVVKYLDSKDADKICQERIRKAYADKLAVKEFLEAESTKTYVELVQELSYDSITPFLTTKQLRMYKGAIESIIYSKYAIPYITPIDGAIVKRL